MGQGNSQRAHADDVMKRAQRQRDELIAEAKAAEVAAASATAAKKAAEDKKAADEAGAAVAKKA